MIFRTLGLCLLFLSITSVSEARKPAVEDFVGIEVDEAEATPHSSDTLFNLEQDMSKLEASRNAPPKPVAKVTVAPKPWSPFSVLGIMLGIGLPMVAWLLVMSHLRKQASAESASNLEVLEKYRKEREKARKSEEEIRKVS